MGEITVFWTAVAFIILGAVMGTFFPSPYAGWLVGIGAAMIIAIGAKRVIDEF